MDKNLKARTFFISNANGLRLKVFYRSSCKNFELESFGRTASRRAVVGSARLLLGAVVVVRVKSRPEVTAPQLQLHRAAVQLGEPLPLCSATAACMIVGSFTARRASTAGHQHFEHNSESYTLSEP